VTGSFRAALLRWQSPTNVDIEECADRGSIRLCWHKRCLLNRQNAGLIQSGKTGRFTKADVDKSNRNAIEISG
jgi:hypothetical protein